MYRKFFIPLYLLFAKNLTAIELEEEPKEIILSGETGGKTNKESWNSNTLLKKGEFKLVFYIDPDEKDKNDKFIDILTYKQTFEREDLKNYIIVNIDASWKPTYIIESCLKRKQKKFPKSIYIKDKKKVLVQKWKLKDDEAVVLLFGKEGKLKYKNHGVMSDTDIEEFYNILDIETKK